MLFPIPRYIFSEKKKKKQESKIEFPLIMKTKDIFIYGTL